MPAIMHGHREKGAGKRGGVESAEGFQLAQGICENEGESGKERPEQQGPFET